MVGRLGSPLHAAGLVSYQVVGPVLEVALEGLALVEDFQGPGVVVGHDSGVVAGDEVAHGEGQGLPKGADPHLPGFGHHDLEGSSLIPAIRHELSENLLDVVHAERRQGGLVVVLQTNDEIPLHPLQDPGSSEEALRGLLRNRLPGRPRSSGCRLVAQ